MVRAAPVSLAVVLAGSTLPVSAWAQSAWLDREPPRSVFVEVFLPQLDRDSEFPSWAWFVTARAPVGTHKTLAFELPYARGEVPDPPFPTSEGSLIGNPYIGIAYAPRPSGLQIEAGIRLPFANENSGPAPAIGFLSDIEREEAFIPDQVPIRVALHFVSAADDASRFTYDLRIVPSAWIKTGDGGLSHSEAFLGFGLTLRSIHRDMRWGLGYAGRWNLSNEGGGIANTVHQFEVAADFLHGNVRPGLQLKFPLGGQIDQSIDHVWGATVTVVP